VEFLKKIDGGGQIGRKTERGTKRGCGVERVLMDEVGWDAAEDESVASGGQERSSRTREKEVSIPRRSDTGEEQVMRGNCRTCERMRERLTVTSMRQIKKLKVGGWPP